MDHLRATVKVNHPELGFTIINEADFDEERHELFVEGEDNATSEADEGSEESAETEAVEIPADFRDLKWMQQVAIAKKLDPEFEGKGPEAVALIEAEIERRKSA